MISVITRVTMFLTLLTEQYSKLYILFPLHYSPFVVKLHVVLTEKSFRICINLQQCTYNYLFLLELLVRITFGISSYGSFRLISLICPSLWYRTSYEFPAECLLCDLSVAVLLLDLEFAVT